MTHHEPLSINLRPSTLFREPGSHLRPVLLLANEYEPQNLGDVFVVGIETRSDKLGGACGEWEYGMGEWVLTQTSLITSLVHFQSRLPSSHNKRRAVEGTPL